MLKAVLFDMDGVIVDSEPLHHKAYKKMFQEFQLTCIGDKFLHLSYGMMHKIICKEEV